MNFEKDMCNLVLKGSAKHSRWQIWSDFVIISATLISNLYDYEHLEKREKLYQDVVQKYDEIELEMFAHMFTMTRQALQENPDQDFLGSVFMQLELNNHWNGQFFTPYSICKLMASITFDFNTIASKLKEKRYVSINDPACGAGATLIAGYNHIKSFLYQKEIDTSVLVTGQDIDMIVGLMCYIQLSFLGCSGFIKIGNTITDPMSDTDDKSQYWYTPSYIKLWKKNYSGEICLNVFNDKFNKI